MTSGQYVPSRGDVVWLEFAPQAGREQAGRRPAVTVSPLKYNRKVGLGLFCPVTTQAKGYPFEVVIPDGLPATGVILADQIKNLDWRARRARLICALPSASVEELIAKIRVLFD